MRDSFTAQDLAEAVELLATMPYFPQESRGAVMTQLRRMCPSLKALDWLIDEVVNHVGTWPGLAELRGILCTRYDAADGIDQWCSLPGYRAEDAEARFLEGHEAAKANDQLAGESRQLLQLAAAKVRRL